MQAQKTTRLCIVRDLTEHDIVSRIMRKDNYLIGMLNRGVLALHISLPGVRPKFMLTKTLEWNLQWCILDAMFDESFRIRADFVNNPRDIERRFRCNSCIISELCCSWLPDIDTQHFRIFHLHQSCLLLFL